jgi:uncharacterized 2Fe-2S/4Fe-4S cluster protein (DUF4445 family)
MRPIGLRRSCAGPRFQLTRLLGLPEDLGVKIILQPGDRTIDVPAGASLWDVLFDAGVDFPCGGGGTCGGCRVRVLRAGPGGAPVTPSDAREFSPVELGAGWRLACCLEPADGMQLHIRHWEGSILSDGEAVAVAPREGTGIAIDLGTTSVVVQLVDLETGGILAADAALNRQRRWGEDLMSRLSNALADGGNDAIVRAIREHRGSCRLLSGRTYQSLLSGVWM